ncbi:MAG TPA: AI-2E family transporter [Gemmatimonadales bacterium]|jgi:predicted PurR-regulated permease PerM
MRATPISTIARALTATVVVGLGVLFLWLTIKVDLVIFAGILLAIVLRRLAEWVSRLAGITVGWALALVLFSIVVVGAGIGLFFSQQIAGQIEQLSVQLPAAFNTVANGIKQSSVGKALMAHVDVGGLKASPMQIAGEFFGVATGAVEVVGAAIVILVIGVYGAAEAKLYVDGALRLVPLGRRPRAAEILRETAAAIWYWLLGRLLSMTLLGILAMVGLWALGVPLPFSLGFLVGIMSFVPYLGSIASAVPSVLIAAATSFNVALYVIILFLGLHLIEGYLVVPLVQRRLVHLPPALTLAAQIILGVLAGIIGLLVATPLVAAGIVLVRMIYVEDVLGDRIPSRSERA